MLKLLSIVMPFATMWLAGKLWEEDRPAFERAQEKLALSIAARK